jgi:hypothetical protein
LTHILQWCYILSVLNFTQLGDKMRRTIVWISLAVAVCLTIALGLTLTAARQPASPTIELTAGKVGLKSAGALAFGPSGVLFVGDSAAGMLVAIDTEDTKAPASAVKINVNGVDAKIAALVGISANQLVVNDVAVNPISKNVYLSAARGRNPDAMPLIVRVDASGTVTPLNLDNAKHASVSLTDAPAGDRQRMQTITDMAYINGNVMVAGLSNEEWSSALRSIPYPFTAAPKGATLQIWHSSHGQYETMSPIRTFTPYTIGGQQYVLAAYTCTPLVKIAVNQLKPGAKVKGVEIADLGAGNQPLDMVPYKKDGHEYILIANSSYGVVKLRADKLESYPAIDSPTVTDVAGVPYDKISSVRDVRHLAQIDDSNVLLVMGKSGGASTLQTMALP